jgi:hypothetical protein
MSQMHAGPVLQQRGHRGAVEGRQRFLAGDAGEGPGVDLGRLAVAGHRVAEVGHHLEQLREIGVAGFQQREDLRVTHQHHLGRDGDRIGLDARGRRGLLARRLDLQHPAPQRAGEHRPRAAGGHQVAGLQHQEPAVGIQQRTAADHRVRQQGPVAGGLEGPEDARLTRRRVDDDGAALRRGVVPDDVDAEDRRQRYLLVGIAGAGRGGGGALERRRTVFGHRVDQFIEERPHGVHRMGRVHAIGGDLQPAADLLGIEAPHLAGGLLADRLEFRQQAVEFGREPRERLADLLVRRFLQPALGPLAAEGLRRHRLAADHREHRRGGRGFVPQAHQRAAGLGHRLLEGREPLVEPGVSGPHHRLPPRSQGADGQFPRQVADDGPREAVHIPGERLGGAAGQHHQPRPAGLGEPVDVTQVLDEVAPRPQLVHHLPEQGGPPGAGEAPHEHVVVGGPRGQTEAEGLQRGGLPPDPAAGLDVGGGLESEPVCRAAPSQRLGRQWSRGGGRGGVGGGGAGSCSVGVGHGRHDSRRVRRVQVRVTRSMKASPAAMIRVRRSGSSLSSIRGIIERRWLDSNTGRWRAMNPQ